MKSKTWKYAAGGKVSELTFKNAQTKNMVRKHVSRALGIPERGLRVWTEEEINETSSDVREGGDDALQQAQC
jgi:hypothetical protein